jgi:hypothetical protein
MGFSAGSMTLAGSGKVTGTVPSQGTAAANRSSDARLTGTAVAALSLRFGIGTGCANLFCSYTATLAAGASATYDLYTGTDIKDLGGQAAPFRILRGLEIAIVDGGSDTAGLRIGGAASNEFLGWFVNAGDQQDIFPDSSPYFGSSRVGKSVTSTTCNLKVENTASVAVTIRILLAGSSFVAGQVMGLFPLVLTYS